MKDSSQMIPDMEQQHPTLTIESPNGTVIKLYHPISETYLKQLLEGIVTR